MTDGTWESDANDPSFLGMGRWSDGDRLENDIYLVPGALVVVPEQRASSIVRRLAPLLIVPMAGGVYWLNALGVRWATGRSFLLLAVGISLFQLIAILALRRQRRDNWRFVTLSDVETASASSSARRVPLEAMTGFVDMKRKWGVVLEWARIQLKDGDLSLLSSRRAEVARIRAVLERARACAPPPTK